jgi:pyridoxine 4-dehydrogenase
MRTELRMKQFPNKGAAVAGTIGLGDLTVNRLGFGAMRLCGDSAGGRPRDREHANRVLHRAVELGVNFIDTADSYGPESNESQISQALYPYPPGLVIATKGGLVRPNRRSWVEDGRPDHLRRAVEGSLQRLRLERIDLYQFHAPDPNVPFGESVGALADLQRLGKLRHIGISNVTVAQLEMARSITPIVSVQNAYNLRNRTSEDVLAACERLGIAFLPWYPLGGKRGLKALKIKQVASRHGLTHVASRHGLTHAALSLAWLLVPCVAARQITCYAANPRHAIHRSPRGQYACGRHQACAGRPRRFGMKMRFMKREMCQYRKFRARRCGVGRSSETILAFTPKERGTYGYERTDVRQMRCSVPCRLPRARALAENSTSRSLCRTRTRSIT